MQAIQPMQAEVDRLRAFSFSHQQQDQKETSPQSPTTTLGIPSTALPSEPAVFSPVFSPTSLAGQGFTFPAGSPPAACLPLLPDPEKSKHVRSNPLVKQPSVDLAILTYLDLSTNGAAAEIIASTGRLPKWIQKCSALQYLIGEGLPVTGLDDWVSESLLQLRVLRLPNNKITTWPDHLARLLPYQQITVVDLEGNPCFQNFCDRCPKFANEYARAAGYISSAPSSSKKNSVALRKSSGRDSVLSQSSLAPAKKKSSFFFSRKKKNSIKEVATSSNSPALKPSVSYYEDDSSDDEMLTSLAAPVVNPMLSATRHQSLASTLNTLENGPADAQHPDKWAHKLIEKTEVEKTKILLNLLRDVWELSTRDIIVPSTDMRGIYRSISSTSSQLTSLTLTTSNSSAPVRRSSVQKLKHPVHQRLNSMEVLEHYLDEESVELETPTVSLPDRKNIISLLTKVVDHEKTYVQHLGELMTTYVQSKKRPAKTNKLFTHIPALYQLHFGLMLGTLQRCLDGYVNRTDPNLDKLAECFTSHIDELRVYVDYELGIDESIRLVKFWKRIGAIETNQPSMQYGGAALPHLVSYRHPDAYIAEWIQSCAASKTHTLGDLAEYLQLPLVHLELYRYVLHKLQHITPELSAAYKGFEDICSEIEREKPKAAEHRRMSEFDAIYNLGAAMEQKGMGNPTSGPAARRYLGDAVILLKAEVRLELPSKTLKIPDSIHYMSTRGVGSTTSSSETRSNPVPKVVTKVHHKMKFTLPLFRVIVCEDVVIVTDEDKKKVVKVLDRRQVAASLPWKYPVRENSGDAMPTGDTCSVRSKGSSIGGLGTLTSSSAGTSRGKSSGKATPMPGSPGSGGGGSGSSSAGQSGAVRIQFHDEPVVWYCTLRAFTGSGPRTRSNSLGSGGGGAAGDGVKEARERMVELLQS